MQARARQGLPPHGLRVRRRRRRRVEADARLQEAADAGVRIPVLRLPVAGAGGRRLGRGPLPRHDQVVEYLDAYTRRLGVLERVRFGCKVLGASYVGATEREVAAWERWSGNGEAFGDGTGEWHLTVRHGDGESASTQANFIKYMCTWIGPRILLKWYFGSVLFTDVFYKVLDYLRWLTSIIVAFFKSNQPKLKVLCFIKAFPKANCHMICMRHS
ncbi:hypothetical protein GQ55_4G188600 [Panicum hallii var. hallii]|uniref:Uncharacterized protein n=1 Tax=Panicum hallii var. hallii TaxID=1504633 RepID=A0A2T7DYW3_9POAL|nr:hypothetical protein GQ55_4G188600 [Panicum hallii var. hallii]